MKFSQLAVQEVFILTISSDENLVNIMTLLFQWTRGQAFLGLMLRVNWLSNIQHFDVFHGHCTRPIRVFPCVALRNQLVMFQGLSTPLFRVSKDALPYWFMAGGRGCLPLGGDFHCPIKQGLIGAGMVQPGNKVWYNMTYNNILCSLPLKNGAKHISKKK